MELELLFATTNPAKLSAMQIALKELGIELSGLDDRKGAVPEAPEEGKTPLENARQKAWMYYRHYREPLFSCDSGLYLEGLPEELQPGIHVRTVNGKRLTDEGMMAYYSGLAERYGDLTARYYNAICLILDEDHVIGSMDESLASSKFIITSHPHRIIRKGFPLDSLSKDIHTGRYYYDLDGNEDGADELVGYEGFVEFFKRNIG